MHASENETGSMPGVVPWIGLIAGPLLGLFAYLMLPQAGTGGAEDLTDAGRATAGVVILMAVWWITEAIPLEATSLLPIVLFPLLGVSTVKAAAAPYASDVIFLFMGGLMLGLAMERWGLHRRIAMVVLGMVGTRPAMIVGGVLIATAMISMWVSNTASAVMMLPIVMSIVGVVVAAPAGPGSPDAAGRSAFASAAVLAVAYGASIGGVGTLIGTPPNAILAGYVAEWKLPAMTFTRWFWFGFPMVLAFVPVAWLVLTRIAIRVPMRPIPAVHETIARERAQIGSMSRGEWSVFLTFVAAALCWVFREPLGRAAGLIGVDAAGKKFERLTDAGIAIAAALLLFLIPVDARRRVFVLDWPTAVRLPWGVLLLFGGGLSLAEAMTSTGVDVYIGSLFAHLGGLPPLAVVLIVTACVVALTEVASNTAIATTFLPVMYAAAGPLGLHPYALLMPTAMGASLAFMLPMGTPPNALVFASGHVTIRRMAATGLVMNLCAVVIITVMSLLLGPWLLGYEGPPMSR